MKNKILIGAIVVVLAGAGAWFYFNQDKGGNLPEANLLERESFSVLMPEGWQEADTGDDFSAIVINNQEEVVNAKAQEINFKTYFAVNPDSLQGTDLADYIQLFKEQIVQMDVGAVFANEREISIDGREASAFEINMRQSEIDFKVLAVLVKGDGDDLWIITFNTLAENWDGYQNLLSQIVESFQLK